ncbi:hypothetical protein ACH5RR_019644 [Cinchona calisaya]|uniref:AP2/ERF domain-containing protein n=1 Tax=Cinchona calisaya TaxID=153742 RepID=A0ABD2ZPY4_9GENT
MNLYSLRYSDDPLPHPSSPDFQESSSSTSVDTTVKANYSDEEVLLLASNNPKKRAGRKKFRETRHPVYRGVRRRNSGKWVCEVREPNKKSRIWLGTFQTAEMAARAHDVAAIALSGRSACLNFADSSWRLPIPESPDAKDIQKAAAEAAEAFRPSSDQSDDRSNKKIEEYCGISEMSLPENVFFMDEDEDEDEVFGMPGLITNLAEGLMLPPPGCGCGCGVGNDDLQPETDAEMSLWSYSI